MRLRAATACTAINGCNAGCAPPPARSFPTTATGCSRRRDAAIPPAGAASARGVRTSTDPGTSPDGGQADPLQLAPDVGHVRCAPVDAATGGAAGESRLRVAHVRRDL